MIEIGIFDTGALDLPFKQGTDGIRVTDGTLADVHAATSEMMKASIQRMVLADRLGYDIYWLVEHHFNIEGMEISPNPLQVQSAAAMLTSRIRLGQLANIVTWHHPLRLAEQIALLDVLSGGRVECGLARGYQPRETETFGQVLGSTTQDQERNRSYFEEAIAVIKKAWTEESFSHHGEFFSIPPTWAKWNHSQTIAQLGREGWPEVEDVLNIGPPDLYSGGMPVVATTTRLKQLSVLPQPVQKPYPPLWEGITSDRSCQWAARNGVNGNFFYEPRPRSGRRSRSTWPRPSKHRLGPTGSTGGEFKPGWDGDKRRGLIASRVIHVQEGDVGNLKRAGEGEMALWISTRRSGSPASSAIPASRSTRRSRSRRNCCASVTSSSRAASSACSEGILKLREDAYLGRRHVPQPALRDRRG